MAGAMLLCLVLYLTVCTRASVIPDQAWGYVTVRPEAHMFWWLYGCSNASVARDQQPLVMWLQVPLSLPHIATLSTLPPLPPSRAAQVLPLRALAISLR